MTLRPTATLAICALSGALAVAALALPGRTDTATAADGVATTVAGYGSAEPATATPGSEARIEIADFAFGAPLTVAPGAVVEVVNVDTAPHTVTASGFFDTGTLDGGASGSFVAPSEPGTYAFICTIHPSMTGTLTVG